MSFLCVITVVLFVIKSDPSMLYVFLWISPVHSDIHLSAWWQSQTPVWFFHEILHCLCVRICSFCVKYFDLGLIFPVWLHAACLSSARCFRSARPLRRGLWAEDRLHGGGGGGGGERTQHLQLAGRGRPAAAGGWRLQLQGGGHPVDLTVAQGYPQVCFRACECLVRVSECVCGGGGGWFMWETFLLTSQCPGDVHKYASEPVSVWSFSVGVFKVCVCVCVGGGGHVRDGSADLPMEQTCPQAHFRTCEFWSVSGAGGGSCGKHFCWLSGPGMPANTIQSLWVFGQGFTVDGWGGGGFMCEGFSVDVPVMSTSTPQNVWVLGQFQWGWGAGGGVRMTYMGVVVRECVCVRACTHLHLCVCVCVCMCVCMCVCHCLHCKNEIVTLTFIHS